MGNPLPPLPRETFEQELRQLAPVPLTGAGLEALWIHYEELRRWNPRLSLVGPGTAQEVLARHYGEALAALPLLSPGSTELPKEPQNLLDIGSGAGFPGLVLAAAAPNLAVTLVEARQRKAAFLNTALRKSGLPSKCLNGRVSLPLPKDLPRPIDVLTLRALKLPVPVLAALAERGSPGARALFWLGQEEPDLPPGWIRGRQRKLPGSRHRRIQEWIINQGQPPEGP